MWTDQILAENSKTIVYFDDLQSRGYHPRFSLYCGKYLMVTSYQAQSVKDKLHLFFLRIKVTLFNFMGWIREDQSSIVFVKNEVLKFHYRNCKELRQIKVKSLKEENKSLNGRMQYIKDEITSANLLEQTAQCLKKMDQFQSS